MFSGIIEKKAKILNIDNGNYTVDNIFNKILKTGISIAHDGACMTITESDSEKYSFFVMEESIKRTNFKNKKTGDFFNIEGSLKLLDTMDGHFVSGHIDTTGEVVNIKENNDGSKYYNIKFSNKYSNLIIDKGSITINGVSLTIVDDLGDQLSVSIIPLTQEITNIGDLKISDTVNLEFDILGKYINKLQLNRK
ncbi:MAG: riboflavin synthase [Candidatus Gracilibacteria bacterium]|nr:riboflavin synthase [Candidatus Gracilibacteria bacterium]MDQ7023332.1 riboflavin synthase [Candidatus Gracilibacteria bacterium]